MEAPAVIGSAVDHTIVRCCRSADTREGISASFSDLLALAAAAPAALADPRPPHPPPGWYKHPPLPSHTHTVISGGMPGWQVTLIAAAAVLFAALAVTAYRIRAARSATPSAA